MIRLKNQSRKKKKVLYTCAYSINTLLLYYFTELLKTFNHVIGHVETTHSYLDDPFKLTQLQKLTFPMMTIYILFSIYNVPTNVS